MKKRKESFLNPAVYRGVFGGYAHLVMQEKKVFIKFFINPYENGFFSVIIENGGLSGGLCDTRIG